VDIVENLARLELKGRDHRYALIRYELNEGVFGLVMRRQPALAESAGVVAETTVVVGELHTVLVGR